MGQPEIDQAGEVFAGEQDSLPSTPTSTGPTD
jgi:hypothetical protein